MNWDGLLSLMISVVEITLIINLFIFVDKNKINWLIILLISLFAAYQFFEFLICNQQLKKPLFSYIALSIITLIPTINLILINRILSINKKNALPLEIIFSLLLIFFIIYYGLNFYLFSVEKCTLFYATYNYPLGFLYGLYYYSPILISFYLLFNKFKISQDKFFNKGIKILLYGYFFIITPPLVGFILLIFNLTEVINSMESILCKFAFFYAIALSFYSLINSKFKDERNYFKYLSYYK